MVVFEVELEGFWGGGGGELNGERGVMFCGEDIAKASKTGLVPPKNRDKSWAWFWLVFETIGDGATGEILKRTDFKTMLFTAVGVLFLKCSS